MRVSAEDSGDVARNVRCVDKDTGEVIYGVLWADTDTREVHRVVGAINEYGKLWPVEAPPESGEDWLTETVLMDFRLINRADSDAVLAETV